MRKILTIAGVLAACVQIGRPSRAESWAPSTGAGAGRGGSGAVGRGERALSLRRRPASPFREELASDYFDDVLEFEHQLKLLKAGVAAAARTSPKSTRYGKSSKRQGQR